MQLILRNSCSRDRKLLDNTLCPEFKHDYNNLHDNHKKVKKKKRYDNYVTEMNIIGVK